MLCEREKKPQQLVRMVNWLEILTYIVNVKYETKISQLTDTILGDENILRFDIQVDEIVRMKMIDCFE